MNAFEAKVSDITHQKVRSWYRLDRELERARDRLAELQKEFDTAKRDLGSHLCPDAPPAQIGEKFNLWYGSGLLEIEYAMNSTDGPRYNIGWRQTPGMKQLSDMA